MVLISSEIQLISNIDLIDPLICFANKIDWFRYDRDLRHEKVKSWPYAFSSLQIIFVVTPTMTPIH